MPAVATLEEFEQSIRDADASAVDLVVDPEASAVVRQSLQESGLPQGPFEPDVMIGG